MYSFNKYKVVIIGEVHGVIENVEISEKIFREMSKFGKVTVGFEWPKSLVANPTSADKSLLDDGRYSSIHQKFLEKLKGNNISAFGFDIKTEEWHENEKRDVSWRDEQMANNVNVVLDKLSENEMLLLVCGDAHFQTKPSLIKTRGEVKEYKPMASMLHTPSILAIHLKYLSGQFWNFSLKDVRTYEIIKERHFRESDEVVEYEVAKATPIRLS